MKRLLAIVVLWLTGSGYLHAQSDELLEPERAFALSASVASAEQLSFTWEIAEGYYMYRDKFSIKVESGEATIKELVMPDGKMKADEFFGDMEIYTGTKVIHALMDRNANAQEMDIVVEVAGQGCNEPVGVCYPPLKQSVSLQLAALDTGGNAALSVEQPLSQQSSGVDSLQSLRDLLGAGQAEQTFLDPEEAFRFDLSMRDPGNLGIRFEIADGYYLYRDKIEFSSKTDGVGLAAYQLPPGVEKEDEYFGRTAVYYDGFDASLPLKNHALGGSEAIFQVTYQGCAEKGICYPPIEKDVVVDLLPFRAAHAATPAVAVVAEPPAATGFWGYVIGAFGVGVLLTFTPCVLPMVPIMSSFIVGQSGGSGRARGGMLSAVYVLGTAVTYTAAGALAGATGDQLQAYFQNIWFIGFLSAVLVLLALSMFDIYELQMPSSVQSRLQQSTTGMAGGGLIMVFLLGVISALIVGACVSPLLIGALGIAIVEGDPVLGAAIMFAIAMGMGVFLVLIGFGMGKMVPRAGAWMNYVKYGFGIILIGTAIYLLGTIHWIPVLYLWSALLIITAVYCGALQALPEGASGWRYLLKGIGVFVLAWGVLALLGAMSGGRDILKPVNLSAIRGQAMEASTAQVHFAVVNNLDSLDEQLDAARLAGKPVMLDYYADWCVDCLRMEESTFKDPQVVKALGNFTLVQVDVTDAGDASSKAVKKRYGVYGPPAMLFFDTAGSERSDLRRYGYMSSDEFLAHIGNL